MLILPPLAALVAWLIIRVYQYSPQALSDLKEFTISAFPAAFAPDVYAQDAYVKTIEAPEASGLPILEELHCGYFDDGDKWIHIPEGPIAGLRYVPEGKEFVCVDSIEAKASQWPADIIETIATGYKDTLNAVANAVGVKQSQLESFVVLLIACGFIIGLTQGHSWSRLSAKSAWKQGTTPELERSLAEDEGADDQRTSNNSNSSNTGSFRTGRPEENAMTDNGEFRRTVRFASQSEAVDAKVDDAGIDNQHSDERDVQAGPLGDGPHDESDDPVDDSSPSEEGPVDYDDIAEDLTSHKAQIPRGEVLNRDVADGEFAITGTTTEEPPQISTSVANRNLNSVGVQTAGSAQDMDKIKAERDRAMNTLNDERAEFERERQGWVELRGKLESKSDSLQAQTEALQGELVEQKDMVEGLTKQLQDSAEFISKLETSLEQLESRRKGSIDREVSKRTEQLEQDLFGFTETRNEVEVLRKALEETEEAKKRHAKHLADLEESKEELRNELQRERETIERLEAEEADQRAKHEAQIDSLEIQQQRLGEEHQQALQDMRQAHDQETQTLRQQLTSNEQRIAELQERQHSEHADSVTPASTDIKAEREQSPSADHSRAEDLRESIQDYETTSAKEVKQERAPEATLDEAEKIDTPTTPAQTMRSGSASKPTSKLRKPNPSILTKGILANKSYTDGEGSASRTPPSTISTHNASTPISAIDNENTPTKQTSREKAESRRAN